MTYRRDDLLGACLASIRAACPTMPQTVVVDNGDTPETQVLVQAYDNTVYIRSPGNPGFAGGNNIGLPACSGEYILLLNNDTVIHEEPFTHLMRYMDEHPGVAVVQGRMTLPALGGVLDDCGAYLTRFGVQLHNYLRQPDGDDLVPAAVFSAKGACLLFRREVIAKVGGFLFHGHFGSYYEETDFCHRVWLAGHEVHFVPSPPISHLCGATASTFDGNVIWRRYSRNTLFLFLTLLGTRGLVTLLPGLIALLMAQALRNLLSGRFTAAGVPF
ncbi:MAG: glycosyltransferase family 2 protein, partial [Kiritimatiellaeota bacterium]|nr:glycosyltransferase family 2 protein [Kiritimatiellota bacterium]